MNVFRKCVVRMGNSAWHASGNGKWTDLGSLTDTQIGLYCASNRLPLLSVRVSFPERRTPVVASPDASGYTNARGVVGRY